MQTYTMSESIPLNCFLPTSTYYYSLSTFHYQFFLPSENYHTNYLRYVQSYFASTNNTSLEITSFTLPFYYSYKFPTMYRTHAQPFIITISISNPGYMTLAVPQVQHMNRFFFLNQIPHKFSFYLTFPFLNSASR